MHKSARIYLAGHRGLVGSALARALHRHGYSNLITRSHAELDLADAQEVNAFFDEQRPEYVMLAAVRVRGILANRSIRPNPSDSKASRPVRRGMVVFSYGCNSKRCRIDACTSRSACVHV